MKSKNVLMRMTALLLVVILAIPNVSFVHAQMFSHDTFDDSYDSYDLSTWHNLPEIPPYEEADSFCPIEFVQGVHHSAQNNAYNTDADNELTEMSPEEREAFFSAREAAGNQDFRIRELNELNELINSGLHFSELTESNLLSVFRHFSIAYESFSAVTELFSQMETDGLSLSESAQMIKIISGGIFNYEESKKIVKMIPCETERLEELGRVATTDNAHILRRFFAN
ncbi:MAG: hypothetical protein FWD19_04410 [Defluviitaleaceae bacterium]|nr:hypothetical protein [Defluviitaleaceae bacterium]